MGHALLRVFSPILVTPVTWSVMAPGHLSVLIIACVLKLRRPCESKSMHKWSFSSCRLDWCTLDTIHVSIG